jgi:hypothetical protein
VVWRKSSFSGNENCVELAHLGSAIAVRDSKDPEGTLLTFPQLPSGPPSIVIATKIMQAPKPE